MPLCNCLFLIMSTYALPLKQVSCKVKKCPNPLFEKWLKEWKQESVKNGSDMQYCFSKALKSLQKFPIKLKSGKECIMLENFGAKICQMLDDKLLEYRNLHSKGDDVNLLSNKTIINKELTALNKRKSIELSIQKKRKSLSKTLSCTKKSRNLNYMPTYRSGGYAILVAMYKKSCEDNFKGFVTKAELLSLAQEFCDSSFTKPLPGSNYTAWASMGVLIRKQLVEKEGNPSKFKLTDDGKNIAAKLKLEDVSEKSDDNTLAIPNLLDSFTSPTKNLKSKKARISTEEDYSACIKNNCSSKSINSNKQVDCEEKSECRVEKNQTIFMLPNNFEIILLVDNMERDNVNLENDMTLKQLKMRHVNFETRSLKVGDFTWIARDKQGNELVLPYIIERKRMDDLGQSIKDGRFHEQKFRLKQSGIENLIYLIENYGTEKQRLGLPLPTLMQAISNTQIVNNFIVKITSNHNHSMRYLSVLTTLLIKIFKDKTLVSCTKLNLPPSNLSDDIISLMSFQEFNEGSKKNKKLTVNSMLVKHLLQLNNLSVEKAKAIVKLYPTPKILMSALRESDGEKTIAKLTFGGLNRSIGPVIAKQIHMLYTSLVLT